MVLSSRFNQLLKISLSNSIDYCKGKGHGISKVLFLYLRTCQLETYCLVLKASFEIVFSSNSE